MKQAWIVVEAAAYNKARARPLTVVRGKPNRSDYITWRKELESTAADYDISDTYSWTVDAAGNNYGCLHDVMDDNDYQTRTGITTYVEPVEPPHYDPNIDATTPTFQRKQLEEEHEQKKHDFFTWKGAARGLAENLRDAMEEQYYSELKHSIIGYRNVTTLAQLEHLDDKWTPMNPKEKKLIKKDYFKPWDVPAGVALGTFTKRLDERKAELVHHNIAIDEDEMKEHYIEQMYQSKVFSKEDMKAWGAKSEADRDDWDVMKAYFKSKMKQENEFKSNTDDTAASAMYGSTANTIEEDKLADLGDEIREYIQQITQAKEIATPPAPIIKPVTSNASSEMEMMKAMMAKMESMMLNMCNNNNTGGGGSGGGGSGDNKKKRNTIYEKYRNMGEYCHSCGFHPVGKGHTSKTCKYKKPNHDDNSTWSNRGAGSMFWPTKVREDEKTHATYAGKSAPTN